ncbi:AraC family transcriptional regulator [Pseudoxanthomonas wuyuanensis]|uniref:Transcriptional regulator, AraC family n=1 Tax=Pseudoxanthomonas wuyuanensis TaxID=1073196 RepID=A0A286D655_9GAMM|nr:helix-turn-helix domain-containing protein [Pseudoxanthomonas wuyuanensis]SOD54116.1 transcriptional regulator, AraC family [Pseudoxanthomonas wuyuanensis]
MRTPPSYETRHGACDLLHTHRHDGAYAALVVDGSHIEVSPDGPIECVPGTLLLHPRWHTHGNRFGRHGARVVNIALATGLAGDGLHVLRVANVKEAQAMFVRAPHRLGELIAAGMPAERLALPAWQTTFLHELEHGDLDISVLARYAGVSLAHVSRSFRKSHGMPPQLLRRELRCRRALRLLDSGRGLADIAALSGFADQAHLSRTLRAATGATPSQLRRQVKSVQDAGR